MGFLRFCVHEKIISGNDVSSARCYPRELCPGFSSGQYSLSIVGLTFGESGTGYDSGTCHVREEKGINASMPRYRASDQLSRLRLRQSRQQFPSYPGSFLSYRYWCGLITFRIINRHTRRVVRTAGEQRCQQCHYNKFIHDVTSK